MRITLVHGVLRLCGRRVCALWETVVCLFFRRLKTKIALPCGEDSPLSAAFMHLNRAKAVKSQTPACRHQTCPISKTGWSKSV